MQKFDCLYDIFSRDFKNKFVRSLISGKKISGDKLGMIAYDRFPALLTSLFRNLFRTKNLCFRLSLVSLLLRKMNSHSKQLRRNEVRSLIFSRHFESEIYAFFYKNQ